tara:strand:+ start:252 stop:749 length:498 start_codon:yes stop_codon:yes gene_type:complete
MNLRQKFIWNVILAVSIIILAWNSYFQFNKHSTVQKAYQKFRNEEVGTDKELQNMIVDLEQNLSSRQSMKFKIKDNPLELTKIILLDGSTASLTGQKGIDCKAAWSNGDGTFSTLCKYKAIRYELTVGDSIGGGVVTNITDSKVFIYKDEKELLFNFGLDKYNNN